MPRHIYLVVKHWPNGRVEIPEAWPTEEAAKEGAQKHVSPGVNYTVSVWQTEMKDG